MRKKFCLSSMTRELKDKKTEKKFKCTQKTIKHLRVYIISSLMC